MCIIDFNRPQRVYQKFKVRAPSVRDSTSKKIGCAFATEVRNAKFQWLRIAYNPNNLVQLQKTLINKRSSVQKSTTIVALSVTHYDLWKQRHATIARKKKADAIRLVNTEPQHTFHYPENIAKKSRITKFDLHRK